MEHLNAHRLWLFLQVVDLGGFSAAASKLFMSQPSVSHQVRQLEKALGATLVDRSGGRATATAEGEALAEYARRMLLLGEEAVTAVRQVQGLQRGHLGLGGTTTVGTYLLPQLLGRFSRDHADIECSLYVGNAEQVTHRLLAGETGLAVYAGTPEAAQLDHEEILTDRLVVITSPEHRLAGRSVCPDELATERLVVRERGSATRTLQVAAFATWGLTPPPSMEVWGTEAVKQTVRAGLGVSLVSEHTVVEEIDDGRLGLVTVSPEPAHRPIVVARRRDRPPAPSEVAFVELLRQLRKWPTGDAAPRPRWASARGRGRGGS